MKAANASKHLFISVFFCLFATGAIRGWSWESAENVLPSLREDLDKEIAAYRQQVGNGISIQERILALDQIIGNYKPLGLDVVDLETERARLMLQEKQLQLRSAEVQDQATKLYERGITEYREGLYRASLETFREAERLLPQDESIREVRLKLTSLTSVTEEESSKGFEGFILRLAVVRFLENDPKRALNALIYAEEKKVTRPEVMRIRRLVEKYYPEVQMPQLTTGISLVEFKLQSALEGIYDGRYLTAIGECTDVLDLEPQNVLALTRLGSAYYAMNEREKAKKIWTQALQLDPENAILKKFLYGMRGKSRVEGNR